MLDISISTPCSVDVLIGQLLKDTHSQLSNLLMGTFTQATKPILTTILLYTVDKPIQTNIQYKPV